MMIGLQTILREITYGVILYGVVMIMTFLLLLMLTKTKPVQNTGVEALATVAIIFIVFGIPYIIVENTLFIGVQSGKCGFTTLRKLQY